MVHVREISRSGAGFCGAEADRSGVRETWVLAGAEGLTVRPPHIPHRTKPRGRVPVMTQLRDEFAMCMRTGLWCLEHSPNVDAFDAVAAAFNLLQVYLKDDARRSDVAAVISDGASALIEAQPTVAAGTVPPEHLLSRIRAGVNAIDALLGKLDVHRLYAAMQELRMMAALEAAKQ